LVFADLAVRSLSSRAQGRVEMATFLRYCEAPGVIGERLFHVFEDDGAISESSFLENLTKILSGTDEDLLPLTFKM
jgi:hypothetical protein